MMDYGCYFGGKWIETEEKLEVRNPYNSELIGTVSLAGKAEMDMAAERAVDAFEITKRMMAAERSEILMQIVSGIQERQDEFARVIALEAGKAINSAELEVKRAITTLVVAAEEAKRISGEVILMDLNPVGKYKIGLNRRFPLGVVLGITPFNFPLNLTCHKIGPALAMGNSIIIKPASQTPFSMMLLAEVIENTDLPKGAFIVLPCKGAETEYMVTCPHIKKITFTGSPAVGWRIKELAPRAKVTLELGGNAALVIHNDANVEYAAKRAVMGGFVYNGQVCISVQRVLVHSSVFQEALCIMKDETLKLKAGDQLDKNNFITAMISADEADRVEQWINEAIEQGAEVITGNKREGNIIYPTILTKTKPEMKVNSHEVFGPVITVEKYENFEDAVNTVNESRYGLQAGYFTRDIGRIAYAYNETEVGGVIINDFPTFRLDHMPYGGVKDSGFGREGIRYAMEEMSEPRLLVIDTQTD
ncbi:MAG: aldehyde dehydrogenase family protein [Acidobacteria bacterium]|nr:aldehyde dehydrogenase family protein [Acidobacteriota bacterium]